MTPTIFTHMQINESQLPLTNSVVTAPKVKAVRYFVPVLAGDYLDASSKLEVEVPHTYNVAVGSWVQYTYDGAPAPVPVTRPMGENVTVARHYMIHNEIIKFVVPVLPEGVEGIWLEHIAYAASSAFVAGHANAVNKYCDLRLAVWPGAEVLP